MLNMDERCYLCPSKIVGDMARQKKENREKEIYRVTVVGSVVNLLLLVFKFFAGVAGHSAAMLADAVHSLSDFITDIIVIVFVRISAKPEDEGHDYGHGKYETLATAIIGIFLLFVGFGIFWNGASSIYDFLQGGTLQEPGILALVAAIVSIVFKEVLYQYTAYKGRKLNSQAVVANAWHHRSGALFHRYRHRHRGSHSLGRPLAGARPDSGSSCQLLYHEGGGATAGSLCGRAFGEVVACRGGG